MQAHMYSIAAVNHDPDTFKKNLEKNKNFTCSTDRPTQKKLNISNHQTCKIFLCFATVNWGLNNQYFVLNPPPLESLAILGMKEVVK